MKVEEVNKIYYMKPPKIFIKNEKEAEVFVSEFSILLGKSKSHKAIIRKVTLLQRRIKRRLKSNSKPRLNNILAGSINYNKELKIISNFIPESIKSTFRAYPPYVLCIKSQIFDRIKGTKSRVDAFAFPFSNCIMIAEDYKKDIHCLLIHEFLHYTSELGSNWDNWKKGVNTYRPWVIEGITELYTRRLAIARHITCTPHEKYDIYSNIIAQIEEILGKEHLKRLYFSGDIKSIIQE